MAQQAVVAPVPTPELPILGGLRWYQIPLSSLRAPSTGLFSRRFQDSLQRYRQLRLTKRLRVGRPYALLGDPDPASPPAQDSRSQRPRGSRARSSLGLAPCRAASRHWRGSRAPHRKSKRMPHLPQGTNTSPDEAFPADWSPVQLDFLCQAGMVSPSQDTAGSGEKQDDEEELLPLAQLLGGAARILPEPGMGLQPDPDVNSLAALLQERRAWCLVGEGLPTLPDDSSEDSPDDTPMPEEHRLFLERFALVTSELPDFPPGEGIFGEAMPTPASLPAVCVHGLAPQSPLEAAFLDATPAGQVTFVRTGLLTLLYRHVLACPPPVLHWLFQLASQPAGAAPSAFQALWEISMQQIDAPELWCPSLGEVGQALQRLGAHQATLSPPGQLPLELLPPAPSCPPSLALGGTEGTAYSTVVLGAQLSDIYKLPALCGALAHVSQHHHNLVTVVRLLPDTTARGRQLRQHLSLCLISRLLGMPDGTVVPSTKEGQLRQLCCLLALMKPAALRCHLPPPEPWSPGLDWEACYLCYSLLSLADTAVGTECSSPEHKCLWQELCAQLQRHLGSGLPEGPGLLFVTQLKCLVTHTYVKWQATLTQCPSQVRVLTGTRAGTGPWHCWHSPSMAGGQGGGSTVGTGKELWSLGTQLVPPLPPPHAIQLLLLPSHLGSPLTPKCLQIGTGGTAGSQMGASIQPPHPSPMRYN
ncbi:protein FAM178B isoform X2 [Alligator mississippiensis]|uniref:protein FAM178B isoform X2 n=1 Tax=Alligator mississippiensis TaxID=8496 RepID=UPI002877F3F1|nr:protein FAM178B isoform X2 [Alligator mississippiensis]